MKTLYKVLQVFTLFTALSAAAAPTPEKHPVDNFQIGVGSSSAQKNFLFDLGLGASNPSLGVDTTLGGLNYSKNFLQWGDGNASQKSFTANIGAGATNPKIIWDNANGTWAFSNDGTNFSSFGSGSGGASGIQLLTNGDFESGITLGWSSTGGTFSVVTAGANLLVGKKSATFTASASGQSVQSSLYTVPNGLISQGCAASMMYKGGDNGLTFQVVDGSANILASQIIQTSTNAQIISMPFQCPSSGSIRVKVLSNAPAALIALDQMFLGQNTLIAVSQASWMGGLDAGAGCTYTNAGTSGNTDFTDSGSCNANVTPLGQATFISSNGTLVLNNAPPGEYRVVFQGQCESGQIQTNGSYVLYDGTTYNTQVNIQGSPSANLTVPCTMEGHWTYTTAGNRSWRMQTAGVVGKTVSFAGGEFASVYRFPTQSEIAVRPETINWNVQAQVTNVNVGMGVTSPGLSQYVLDPSNTMNINNTGSILATKPCVGVGVAPAPGTGGCGGAGQPVFGVSFTPPSTGKIEVCFDWNVAIQAGAGSGSTYDSAHIEMTPANDDTVFLQTGGSYSTISNVDPGSTELHGGRQHICEIFTINNINPIALRLFNAAVVSGANGTRNEAQFGSTTGGGASSGFVTVRPVTQNVPAPVVVYQSVGFSVVSNGNFSSPGSGRMNLWTVEKDTSGTWDPTNNWWVVPVTGRYLLTANAYVNDGFSYSNPSVSLALNTDVGTAMQCIASTSLNHATGCGGTKIFNLSAGNKVYLDGSWTCSTDSLCHWDGAGGRYLQGELMH